VYGLVCQVGKANYPLDKNKVKTPKTTPLLKNLEIDKIGNKKQSLSFQKVKR